MDLSFNEIAILSVAGNTPKTRVLLAQEAARMYGNSKFDSPTALAEIKNLEQQGYLTRLSDGKLQISYRAWATLVQAIPVIQNLYAALGGVAYRPVR